VTRLARAFLAVTPSPDALDDVARRLGPLRQAEPRLRWLARGQWHLTVQFLGAVSDAEGLADAVSAAVASLSPFAVELTGGGAFPSPRRASVLWVGVRDPEPLATLAGAVTRATATLGHAAEDRAYHPHLTVARAGRPCAVMPLVDALGGMGPGPAWTVSDVALVESDTRREGAVHTERARLVLDG
jgi:RNA 2',3'-cyclic 3'-phosphodiesterase